MQGAALERSLAALAIFTESRCFLSVYLSFVPCILMDSSEDDEGTKKPSFLRAFN